MPPPSLQAIADIPTAFISTLALWAPFVSIFVTPMPKGEFLFALYLITTFGWASGYQCGNQPVRQAGLDVLFTIWPPRRSATVLGVLARGAYSPERLICAQAATLLASSCPTATAAFQPSRGRCSGRFSGRAKRSGSMICLKPSFCFTRRRRAGSWRASSTFRLCGNQNLFARSTLTSAHRAQASTVIPYKKVRYGLSLCGNQPVRRVHPTILH